MIKKNKDILLFQALNWSGSYFLYVSFLKTTPTSVFSKIAAGEIFFGALGAFLMTWSLRRFEESPSLRSEINSMSYRLLILSTVIIIFIVTGLDFIYMLAAVPILLTPTHLPLKFGFEKVAYLLISLKLIFAFFAFFFMHNTLYGSYAAFIYFLPAVIYGIGIYILYLPKLADVAHLPRPHRVKHKAKKLSLLTAHVVVTILSSLVSATAISKIVEVGWIVASIERLARSGYSFLYPHLIRKGAIGGRFFIFTDAAIVAISVALCFYSGKYMFLLLAPLPVLIDMFMTNGAGRSYKSDGFMLVVFLTLLGVIFD